MQHRAHRLLSLADAALAQADATARAVEELLDAVGARRPAPTPSRPAPTVEATLDSARLVAIEMAVAGRSREEVGAHVRACYDLADVEALLDDVFGPVAA